jgi:hypothetical protein
MARYLYCSSTLVVLASIAACPYGSAMVLSSSSRRPNAFVCKASNGGDDANIINVAIASPEEANYKDELQKAMLEHPLLSMIDATANIMEVPPLSEDAAKLGRFENDALQDLDVACFASPEEVKQWVQDIDATLGLEEVAEEDKRLANGDVMAACIGTETARVCLESGRWESRNIYYPKGQKDSVEGWAASAVQAVGDLNERRFWGEGAW